MSYFPTFLIPVSINDTSLKSSLGCLHFPILHLKLIYFYNAVDFPGKPEAGSKSNSSYNVKEKHTSVEREYGRFPPLKIPINLQNNVLVTC